MSEMKYTATQMNNVLSSSQKYYTNWKEAEKINKELRARISELAQAVGLITTLKPTMVMDVDHPLDMAKEVTEYVTTRIAELVAENGCLQESWLWETVCPDGSLRPKVSELLLNLDGWKERSNGWESIVETLNTRIAELESAQRWRVVADGELPDDDVEVFVLLYGSSVSTGKHYRNARYLDLEDNSYDLNYVIGDCWLIGDDETTCAQHCYNAVTHWMPLPEPPEVQE